MVPLKKRRQNTSLFKYLEDQEGLSEKQDGNIPLKFSSLHKNILCVYERNCYLDNKIKHIF